MDRAHRSDGAAHRGRSLDIPWFRQPMHKYRRLLSCSFLHRWLFQLVIDKALTHHVYTTLDVLVFALRPRSLN